MKSFFSSPLFPIIFIATAILSSFFLLANPYWLNAGLSDLKNYFQSLPLIFSILIPMLTMNTWADEKKAGTDMLLLSMPISAVVIVVAKYAKSATIWFFMSILVLLPPLSIAELIYISPASFLYSYITILIFGFSLLSFSQAISFASKHSAINFFFSFILIITFSVAHVFAGVFYKWEGVQNFFLYLSFYNHFENASKGIFDSRDVIYYILLLVFGIELNVFIIKSDKK